MSDREEKMSAIQEKLENGIRDIYSSEKYAEYIRAMSKFPTYSINNCILIVSQCPDASLVCGYRRWQQEFNRNVKKGARGIMIIAPIKLKADVEELVYDADNQPVLDDSGKQLTSTVAKEFRGFRPAYVFDVSQTYGDPIPDITAILEKEVDGFETIKQALIKVSPVPIHFDAIRGGANGYFSPSSMQIVIKEGLPELQTIKTMIHEIAHATLGHGSKEDKWDRETKEVQAESVAYWVSQLIGFDTSDYSFGYITGWSKNREVTELKEHLELIKTTADELAQRIEKELFPEKTVAEEVHAEEAPAAHTKRSRK